MISDEGQNIREWGLRRILKARLEKSSTLRQFKIPKLNVDAGEYFDLIDWQDTAATEAKRYVASHTFPDHERIRS